MLNFRKMGPKSKQKNEHFDMKTLIRIAMLMVAIMGISIQGSLIAFAEAPTVTFAKGSNMPAEVAKAAGSGARVSVLKDGRVLVTGGEYDSATCRGNKTWFYNPQTDTWTEGPNLPENRRYHQQSTLPDGRVVITGGWKSWIQDLEAGDQTWLYDPSTNKFSWGGAVAYIYHHRQKTLKDGRVMVAGGYIRNNDLGRDSRTYDIRIYDPSQTKWEKKSTLVGFWESTSLTMEVMEDGKVFIAERGRINIYDPVTNEVKMLDNPSMGYNNASVSTILDNEHILVLGNDEKKTGYIYNYNKNEWSTISIPIEVKDDRNPMVRLADGRSMIMLDNGETWFVESNAKPTLTINAPTENQYYSVNETNIIPSIVVSDKENETLTCRYYIDTETTAREVKTVTSTATAKTVNFSPISIASLSEGTHTIKFEVKDGLATVTSSAKFIVDKAPILGSITINSSANEITVTGSATDSVSGLNATPYRYTIGSNVSPWITSTTYTQRSLTPNTAYTVKFEARDAKGHIASNTQTIYTKAEVPRISIENSTSYTLDIKIADNNPASTVYQIVNTATNKYLTSAGDETTIPTWIRPNNKILTVRNLSPQTSYSYKVQAKNEAGVETGFSAPATGTTLVTPPPKVGELTATVEMNSITIYWNLVNYATSYEIEGDGVILGSVQGTSFTHTGLITGTEHVYRVRGKNGNVAGPWSEPISKSTLPPVPQAPANINTFATRNNITVTWNSVNGATAYDIEVDGNIISNGNSTNYVHAGLTPNTSHSYRVRSINPAGKSEWSNMLTVITQDEALPIPQNIEVEPYKTKVIITWNTVPGLTYQIEADGNIKNTGALSEYVHDNLIADTEHTYRVRSVKDGSYSDWSRLIIVRTKADIFTVPSNIQGDASDKEIRVSWEAVTDADGYEIEVDGVVVGNGNNTSFIHRGLVPSTNHIYRVRAKRGGEVSQWSEVLSITTYILPEPQNIVVDTTETELNISWSPVSNANGYEIKVDGNSIKNITGTSYTVTGLLKGTQHTVSIRAVSTQGTSRFTTPITVLTKGESTRIPQNISAITTKDQITLIWEKINGAEGYEIKISDQVITGITGNTYFHKNLQPNTEYTYRVRIATADGSGQWSEAVGIKTMTEDPGIPSNLSAAASTSTVLLTWDSVSDAEEYEVQIDNEIVSIGLTTKYLHSGLAPNSQHTYRVRSKNKTGLSPWSDAITVTTNSTQQEYRVMGSIGEEKNLVIAASNITSFKGYTFTLTYNPDEIEIVDLSSLTAKKDENTGNIVGTDIEVIQNQPGILQFKKLTNIPAGQAYTGVINSIRFKLKTTNEVTITYTTK
ncbi:fibronectin type III domain-containing protein [Anaerosolibacter carboniphilus]|nr:fibronectin type III domain-containing protein [Anaerosolibacter carboniphilus]